jgi:hypothetical protein
MHPRPHSDLSLSTVTALLLAWLGTSPLLPAQSLPPLSGISVSMTTSSNRVEISPEALSNPRRNQLAAQIQLRNRSRFPLSYQFATLDEAQTKFTFTVFDSADTAIWTGAARLPTRAPAVPTSTTQILRPSAAWTASVLIPLAPSGSWLPAGTYRIEAVLAGTPSVFAATSFEVVAPPLIIIDPPVKAPTLVSGIDQVSAHLVTNADGAQVIRVSASGWVPHPGYTNPRLEIPAIIPLIIHADGSGILHLDFNVDFPASNAFFIQVITNVNATIDLPFNGQSSVTVRAASGAQSVEISDKPPVTNTRFPIHWGPPPAIQTKDIGELPGGYGMGSSTLATWIRRNMEADAANQPR